MTGIIERGLIILDITWKETWELKCTCQFTLRLKKKKRMMGQNVSSENGVRLSIHINTREDLVKDIRYQAEKNDMNELWVWKQVYGSKLTDWTVCLIITIFSLNCWSNVSMLRYLCSHDANSDRIWNIINFSKMP